MKMSDVFTLPLRYMEIESYMDRTPAKARIAHAVNNHDRLVLENKRLSERVLQLEQGTISAIERIATEVRDNRAMIEAGLAG